MVEYLRTYVHLALRTLSDLGKTRDVHAASALGRPMHIRDELCDTEVLTESDFEENSSSTPGDIFYVQTREHVMYVIHMARLAVQSESQNPDHSHHQWQPDIVHSE